MTNTLGNESGQPKSNVNRSSFQPKQKGPDPSSVTAPAPKKKSEYNSKNSRAKPAYSQGSMAQGGSKPPACAKCGRNHSGMCRDGSTGCFKCGQNSHFMRECPKNKQGNGNGGNRILYSSVAPPNRAASRGAISGAGGGGNRLYAITSHQEQEDSPDVITGMIQVFNFNVYALLDPGASLSFVTQYVSMNFNVLPEQLSVPFSISTPAVMPVGLHLIIMQTQVIMISIQSLADAVEHSEIIMPPGSIVRGRPDRHNVEEQELPNAPEEQPQGEFTNAKFREAIRMLSEAVTNQVGQQREARQEGADTSRIREFLRMNPPSFTGSSTTEDLKNFIKELKKDSLSVHEYGLKFTQLSRYSPAMVANMRSRMSLFVVGLYHLSSKEGSAAMLIGDMDISRLMIYVQQVQEEKPRDKEESRNKKAKTGNESGK
uniref:Retrotransposon gag protein n=1 Tax=Solanum tuberosum TaxID=4113 RepID=M1D9Y9_SOLTU